MAIYLTEAQISELLTMDDTLIVLEELFAARARGEIVNRPRVRMPITAGTYNVMPASWLARGVVGQKVYTASAKGASFQILLHAADGSGLVAVMGGGRISGLRTGGVTGLAARVLGGAAVGGPVAVIGAGFQATMQVNGIVAATGTRDVRVWSRTADKREPFAARMAEATGVSVRPVATVDDALDGAPIVVTITNSAEPVLRADQVRPGMTIIAAGNNTWLRSEIDPAIFAQADLVVVDDLENARIEAGELMRASELGHISWDRVASLGDVIGGVRAGRTSADQLIVCELQGIGIEDVAVAELVARRARERGVGLGAARVMDAVSGHLDVLIKGGWVVDGTGNPPYPADVAIAGDRIVDVGRLPGAEADRIVDATGRYVTPGFIDAHSHSDWTLLSNPKAESAVRQGVTSEVVGNCGVSLAPVTDANRAATRDLLDAYVYPGQLTWGTFGEYLDVVRTVGTSINYAFFAGHNTLRAAAGLAGPDSDEDAQRVMERLVAEAMASGALGMSTGLEFDPGRQAPEAEIARMARVVGRHGGMYVSHIRNRSSELAAAMDEFFRYAEAAGMRGQVSHLNVRENTGAEDGAWEAAVERIERARREGFDVLTDNISMTYGPGLMVGILPPWVLEDGTDVARERLSDPAIRQRLRTECDRYWRFIHRGEWDRVRLSVSPQHPDLTGLPFPEIAARRGTDEWDVFFDLLVDAGPDMAKLLMYGRLYSEQHLADMVAHPLFMLAVDAMNSTASGPLAERTQLPLSYAGQITYLTKFVRDTGLLRLEEAVRKMSSMPATHFGLRERGQLVRGYHADVVVLDLEALRAPATLEHPTVYAEGVTHVLVNGELALDAGEHTGALAGRTLLRS